MFNSFPLCVTLICIVVVVVVILIINIIIDTHVFDANWYSACWDRYPYISLRARCAPSHGANGLGPHTQYHVLDYVPCVMIEQATCDLFARIFASWPSDA